MADVQLEAYGEQNSIGAGAGTGTGIGTMGRAWGIGGIAIAGCIGGRI